MKGKGSLRRCSAPQRAAQTGIAVLMESCRQNLFCSLRSQNRRGDGLLASLVFTRWTKWFASLTVTVQTEGGGKGQSCGFLRLLFFAQKENFRETSNAQTSAPGKEVRPRAPAAAPVAPAPCAGPVPLAADRERPAVPAVRAPVTSAGVLFTPLIWWHV